MAEHNIQQLNRFKIERENTIQFPLRKMLKDSISESILSDIQNVKREIVERTELHFKSKQ